MRRAFLVDVLCCMSGAYESTELNMVLDNVRRNCDNCSCKIEEQEKEIENTRQGSYLYVGFVYGNQINSD